MLVHIWLMMVNVGILHILPLNLLLIWRRVTTFAMVISAERCAWNSLTFLQKDQSLEVSKILTHAIFLGFFSDFLVAPVIQS